MDGCTTPAGINARTFSAASPVCGGICAILLGNSYGSEQGASRSCVCPQEGRETGSLAGVDFLPSVVHDLGSRISWSRRIMKSRFCGMLEVCGLLLLTVCGIALAQTGADGGVSQQMDAIVANYRKIIVLMDGAVTLDPGVRERASTAGKILFQDNQVLLGKLDEQLAAALVGGNAAPIVAFLDRLESDANYRDADKLAFRDALDDLPAGVGNGDDKLANRIREDQNALAQIQALYQREVGEILGDLQTRGMVV